MRFTEKAQLLRVEKGLGLPSIVKCTSYRNLQKENPLTKLDFALWIHTDDDPHKTTVSLNGTLLSHALPDEEYWGSVRNLKLPIMKKSWLKSEYQLYLDQGDKEWFVTTCLASGIAFEYAVAWRSIIIEELKLADLKLTDRYYSSFEREQCEKRLSNLKKFWKWEEMRSRVIEVVRNNSYIGPIFPKEKNPYGALGTIKNWHPTVQEYCDYFQPNREKVAFEASAVQKNIVRLKENPTPQVTHNRMSELSRHGASWLSWIAFSLFSLSSWIIFSLFSLLKTIASRKNLIPLNSNKDHTKEIEEKTPQGQQAQLVLERQEQKKEQPSEKRNPSETEVKKTDEKKMEGRQNGDATSVKHLSAWQINYDDLKWDSLIGEGGFGVVYQGTHLHSPVAIKQLKGQAYSREALQELQHEAGMLSQMQSNFLIRFYGVASWDKNQVLVMEFLPGGSLYDNLHNKQVNIEWPQRFTMATQIAKGLNFLHHHNIIHRDLKSLNVLLDDRFNAKITDFGLSQIKTETASTTTQGAGGSGPAAGSIRWMAPECFKRKAKRGMPTDVYALGMIFWEIASRQVPYANEANNNIVAMWIEKGEQEDIPEDCNKEFAGLILQCWKINPDERPTASQAVEQLAVLQEQGIFGQSSVNSAPAYQGNLNSGAADSEASNAAYQGNFFS